MAIPKPLHCNQNWLDMKPINGGRICGQCQKKIVDFSKMSWAQIEAIQEMNGNAVCGMYNQKQLDYWGQEIPNKSNILKAATITGLATLSLSAYSQNDSIVIKGKVLDEHNEGVIGAVVLLKQRNIGSLTDFDGNVKLVVKGITNEKMSDTLEVKYIGYKNIKLPIDDLKQMKDSSNNVTFENPIIFETPPIDYRTVFYVSVPTKKDKIEWKFRKWFGGRKKNQ